MRKIPTLFVRDPDDRKHVLNEVTPGCEWVLEGDGVATRKYDGTCVMLDEDGNWWARREVKPGKDEPPHFVAVEHDETTNKTVGWEPAAQSSFAKLIQEIADEDTTPHDPGSYELCGPKVNGNPEGFEFHVVVPHGVIKLDNAPRTYDELRQYLLLHTFEGIVWHADDGRMAKLKRRDFQ